MPLTRRTSDSRSLQEKPHHGFRSINEPPDNFGFVIHGYDRSMLISCPKCTTSYRIEPAALRPVGQSMRCLRCRHVWYRANTQALTSIARQYRSDVAAYATDPGPSDHHMAPTHEAVVIEADFRLKTYDRYKPGPDRSETVDGLDSDSPEQDATPNPSPPIRHHAVEEQPAVIPTADGIDRCDTSAFDPAYAQPLAQAPTLSWAGEAAEPIGETARAWHPGDTGGLRADRRGAQASEPAARGWRPRAAGWNPAVRNTAAVGATAIIGLSLIAGAVASLVTWRSDVVRWLPKTASLYAAIGLPVNLRGVVFTAIRTEAGNRNGVQVLTVAGTLVSTSAVSVKVPRLRFAIRSRSGDEIQSWTAPPPKTVLAAGETVLFQSQIEAPSREGAQVLVRFVNDYNRPDVLAALQ
jgi:predicted Zn finger-like uncharacterized protein